MLSNSKAYSGFAVDDADEARRFYRDTLGLTVTDIDKEMRAALAGASGRPRDADLHEARPHPG